jgi:hypothetical protein
MDNGADVRTSVAPFALVGVSRQRQELYSVVGVVVLPSRVIKKRRIASAEAIDAKVSYYDT